MPHKRVGKIKCKNMVNSNNNCKKKINTNKKNTVQTNILKI